MSRIKEAGMACGYKFKILRFRASDDSSVVTIKNTGVAPIYYDAFVAVNGIKSKMSLRTLQPADTMNCRIASGGANPMLTIECNRLVNGQKVEFEADLTSAAVINKSNSNFVHNQKSHCEDIYNLNGRLIIKNVAHSISPQIINSQMLITKSTGRSEGQKSVIIKSLNFK
jgi:hypothetical protein